MKKLLTAFACGLLLMSCSKDEGQQQTPEIKAGSVVFDITAGAPITKGAIYGQTPVIHVTNVKVYAFKSDGTNFLYTQTFNISTWADGITFQRYVVANANDLPVGTYKFIAVGRNTTDMYTLTTLTTTTKFEDMQASITTNGNEEDIYAGNTQIDITGQGTRVSITMKRIVSGVMGYFKNVPQMLNGQAVRYLRLSVTNVNEIVNLTTGAGVPTATTPFNIINIDLQGQSVANGVYTGNDLTNAGVIKVDNSQLSGMFIIPVSGVMMTLGLYDTNGVALKTWAVNNAGSPTFSLTANSLYALGQKMKPGAIDNGTPDPGDDDNPIDLLSNQEIAITIIPAWDVINNLTIQ